MSRRKIIALLGMLCILGAGLALAQNQAQAKESNQVQNRVVSKAQVRTKFMDQNGDGINDLFRDHDNDGVPNCQDPDWTRPQDGTGYKTRFGVDRSRNQAGDRTGLRSGQTWLRESFRKGQSGFRGGVCDGTGPKGRTSRTGRP